MQYYSNKLETFFHFFTGMIETIRTRISPTDHYCLHLCSGCAYLTDFEPVSLSHLVDILGYIVFFFFRFWMLLVPVFCQL